MTGWGNFTEVTASSSKQQQAATSRSKQQQATASSRKASQTHFISCRS
jgi:hypothetical protein